MFIDINEPCLTKAMVYRSITALEIFKNLSQDSFIARMGILPDDMRQCLLLAKLSPKKQREVWLAAVEEAQGKIPSIELIRKIVRQFN